MLGTSPLRGKCREVGDVADVEVGEVVVGDDEG
jgi:hypothetical protein